MTGFEHKCLHVNQQGGSELPVDIQVDFTGDGEFHTCCQLTIPPGGYASHVFPDGFSAHWVRLVPQADAAATAQFVYT